MPRTDYVTSFRPRAARPILEVSGKVDAELKGLASNLVAAGVSAAGSHKDDQYQGVLREHLAAALKDNAACRLKVLEDLKDTFLKPEPTPAPASPNKPQAIDSIKPPAIDFMSCDQLWYARNEIYARNGYCFKTPRAQAAFGKGCFPPYGELQGSDKDRVSEIQMWEKRKGC